MVNIAKMANRPKVCKVHNSHMNSCRDCRITKRKIEKTKRSNELATKVNLEIEFLRSLPEDVTASRKIEKKRITARAVERAAIRAYRGPPLQTKRAIKGLKVRQERLKRQFNREAAEWTVVKKKAKIAYFAQNNPERVAVLENLRFNLINSLMENDQLRLASAQKLAELNKLKELNEKISSRLSLNHQETGNGN